MTTPNNGNPPWPGWIDMLIFCGSITVFVFLGIAGIVTLSPIAGFALLPQEQTVFRYGGTTVLITILLQGTVSFLIGEFVVRRMKRMRCRWLSAAVGSTYTLVYVALSMLIPMGSPNETIYVTWAFFFPAAGLILASLKLKRSNPALQFDRPQAGGD